MLLIAGLLPKNRCQTLTTNAWDGRIVDFDHGTVVAFAKSWGLFYLIAFSIGVIIYTFWPSNKKRFEQAKKDILDKEDKPWT